MPPQRLAPVPVRCFAASTKPAIQLFGVSGRYATALYQVAAEKGALADVEAELTGIAALRDSSPQFANFMDDPTLSVSQRTDTMDAIMAKGGYSETTAKFFGVVIENRRLPDLAKITDDFLKLTAAGKSSLPPPNALVSCRSAEKSLGSGANKLRAGGWCWVADRSELTATVTAAAKVTPKQMAALQKALSAHPEIGKGNEVRPPSGLRLAINVVNK